MFFHDRDSYQIETSPLIWPANQWTNFYIIGNSFMKKLMNIRLKQEVKPAICKSQNGESGNGMRGMMGTRAIRVGKQRIKVGMR